MKNHLSGKVARRTVLSGGVAAAFGLGNKFARAADERTLNLFIWDTYLGENTLSDFKEATGIDVKVDLYADNDELFAKLQGGNPGYDVIVPTNDTLERMIRADMVVPLDHSSLPNMSNIDPRFQDAAFDPRRKHSLPYVWGTIGIGYRKSEVKSVPSSWRVVLDSDEHGGRTCLLGNQQDVLGPALKYLGYSWNSSDQNELKHVEDLLVTQKKNLKAFADDNGQDLLAASEVDLCVEYSGDIKQIMTQDSDVGYVLPEEGSLIWQDTLAIPKGAPHVENAHRFINFLLDGKVGRNIVKTIQYATCNRAAKDLMPAEYRENPVVFPDEGLLNKCEVGFYLGERAARQREEIWTRIQAA
jgi:spermidine/putrescine transport system substrate-binding protein